MTQYSEDKMILPNFLKAYKEKQNNLLKFSKINTEKKKKDITQQQKECCYCCNVPKSILNISGKKFSYIYSNPSGNTMLRLQKIRLCPSCFTNSCFTNSIIKNFSPSEYLFCGDLPNDTSDLKTKYEDERFLLPHKSYEEIRAYIISKYICNKHKNQFNEKYDEGYYEYFFNSRNRKYKSITRECLIVYLKTTFFYMKKNYNKCYKQLAIADYLVKYCYKTNSIKIKYHSLNKRRLRILIANIEKCFDILYKDIYYVKKNYLL